MKRFVSLMLVAMAGCAADQAPEGPVEAAKQALAAPPPPSFQGSWQPLANQPPFAAGLSLLLTDGSIMVQDVGSPNWWKLTPDAGGSYVNGTWTQLASMPDGQSPLYFASAVLPDGRVIVEGGEYQNFEPVWSNTGAIYDPKTDQWTAIAPPAGWSTIGDAQSVVLANGQFMLADCCSTRAALLDPGSLTWKETGAGKADINDEEGWTLLPKGTVLTIDANNTDALNLAELYTPGARNQPGTWASAGDTGVPLADLEPDGDGSHEMGPAVLYPDGTVLAIGATGHTAIYDSATGVWSAGADFPYVDGEGQLDSADGPAVLLPNGRVLAAVSAGLFNAPAHLFEIEGTHLHEMPAPPGAAGDSSFNINFLLLPTGQALFTDFSGDVEIYTPAPTGKPKAAWAPKIDNGNQLATLKRGTTKRLSGSQLNGLSQAVSYGDDAQAATNYPLVRITNRATGHVFYGRTHDHSTMTVARDAQGSTFFDVPASAELGASDLVVVANGIPSAPVLVNVVP